MQFQISVPNVETLGYYRPSLRDDEWQILVALDKMSAVPSTPERRPVAGLELSDGVSVPGGLARIFHSRKELLINTGALAR